MKSINSKHLLEARKRAGMTQAELAKKAFVTKQVISNLEREVTISVDESILNLLSYSLGVTTDYLQGLSMHPDKDKNGASPMVYILPEWDFSFEIKQVLKKHSQSRDVEVLLRNIVCYLAEIEPHGFNQNNKDGIKLLEIVIDLLRRENFEAIELLIDILMVFQKNY